MTPNASILHSPKHVYSFVDIHRSYEADFKIMEQKDVQSSKSAIFASN